MDIEVLREAKRMGFQRQVHRPAVGQYSQHDMYLLREKNGIFPVYKMIDTCASEFSSATCRISTRPTRTRTSRMVSDKKKIVVLGSGPIRIGQGVEFDYSTVHAIWSIREAGYEAIIINNNPETVSTDYTTSDKLYFEPLTVEDVMNVIDLEKPIGDRRVARRTDRHQPRRAALHRLGVPIIGTDCEAIQQRREPRLLREDHGGAAHPAARRAEAVTDIEDGREGRRRDRLSGAGASELRAGRPRHADRFERGARCATTCKRPSRSTTTQPVLVDKLHHAARNWRWTPSATARTCLSPASWSMSSARVSIRATRISVYPTFSVSAEGQGHDHRLHGEARPRHRHRRPLQHPVHRRRQRRTCTSSRSIPARRARCRSSPNRPAVPMADIATQRDSGREPERTGHHRGISARRRRRWYVKAPAFSFAKLRGMDAYLSPEMKSTGEAIGYDDKLDPRALQGAAGRRA